MLSRLLYFLAKFLSSPMGNTCANVDISEKWEYNFLCRFHTISCAEYKLSKFDQEDIL